MSKFIVCYCASMGKKSRCIFSKSKNCTVCHQTQQKVNPHVCICVGGGHYKLNSDSVFYSFVIDRHEKFTH